MSDPEQGRLHRFVWASCAVAEHSALVMLIALTAALAVQIIGREIFDVGLPAADEVARFCGLSMVFLAAPQLLLQHGHVSVELFHNKLSVPVRRRLMRALACLVVLFCALFLFGAWKFMQRAAQFTTPALGMQNSLYYTPALIGVLGLFCVAAYQILAAPPRELAPEDEESKSS
ncbi:MAG: TRAP transporter small permease subunit [Pseudoxanthomonas sp.]